ncbi:MAG: ChaN family lipoprotein [Hyphomicrobiaceae bacterium]|nr:ChaN family lipoprotein [Hyphomicrobiaceae bacterium]
MSQSFRVGHCHSPSMRARPFQIAAFLLALVPMLFMVPMLFLARTAIAQENQSQPAPYENWQNSLLADHPLVGTIWSVKDGHAISPKELIERLSIDRLLLLGEIHDNADHHRLQAWVISQLTARHFKPAIVMEQIRADQAGVLKLFMSGKFKTAERMGPAIGWGKSGWPKWPNYQPIAKAALAAGLNIYAGDTTRAMNRKVGKQGFKALPAGDIEDLGLNHPLGRKLDEALAIELVASHCNMMPKTMMGPMALVQRYRDASLAHAMSLAAQSNEGVILIAGNGHVRTDRAVPWYLRGQQLKSTTLMIVETNKDAQSALDLISHAPDDKATADYIWVTPRTQREDPCAKLVKRFGGKKHGKGGQSEHGKKAE